MRSLERQSNHTMPSKKRLYVPTRSSDANSESASGSEESTVASSHEDDSRPVKKRFVETAGGEESGRKIWMRPCNECGEELHVRRTRCTACGVAQVSKRKRTSAKTAAESLTEAEEAAVELTSFSGRAQSRSSSSSPTEAAAAAAAEPPKLTAEQMLKLLRLRKLHYLLNRPPTASAEAASAQPASIAMLANVACAPVTVAH